MDYQKILNLLNEVSESKFVTRKWNTSFFDVGNEIIHNTEVLCNLIFVITLMLTF